MNNIFELLILLVLPIIIYILILKYYIKHEIDKQYNEILTEMNKYNNSIDYFNNKLKLMNDELYEKLKLQKLDKI